MNEKTERDLIEYMTEWSTAFDGMESDADVLAWRKKLSLAQDKVKELEAPYRGTMAEAGAKIIETVKRVGESVTRVGVYAKFIKGRASKSWKGIALALDPEVEKNKTIMRTYSKIGDPRVSIERLTDG